MTENEFRRGQRVIVSYDSEHRDDSEAVVKRVPPFTEHVAGEEIEHTEKLEVQYPNTSIDGGNLFADISEFIHVDNVEPK